MGDASENDRDPGWSYEGWQLTLRRSGSLAVGNDEYGTTFPPDLVADLVTGSTWRALQGEHAAPAGSAAACNWRAAAFAALDMALALLDVADRIPNEGDLVVLVRTLDRPEPWMIVRGDAEGLTAALAARIAALEAELRRAESELAKERDENLRHCARWHDLERIQDRQLTFDAVAMELADSEVRRRRAEADIEGHIGHIRALETQVSNLSQALANAREDGPWAWCSGEDNHLESMADGMVICISAGQLRDKLRRAEAERDEALKAASHLERGITALRAERDGARAKLAEQEERTAVQMFDADEAVQSAHGLRAKLAELADVAERYRRVAHPGPGLGDARERLEAEADIDAAIADARKAVAGRRGGPIDITAGSGGLEVAEERRAAGLDFRDTPALRASPDGLRAQLEAAWPPGFSPTPTARFRVVTPDRWDDVVRDSFVFGQVAAEAFAAYAPVRMTRGGFLFEATEGELSDEDLQRIGGKLDSATERAFEQRAALEAARTFAAGSWKPGPKKPHRYIVAREAAGQVPPRGDDVGCYDSFGEANDAAREVLRVEIERATRGDLLYRTDPRYITPVLVFEGDVVLTRWTATSNSDARVEVR